MVLLAHVCHHFELSHETYGSPRMHAELTAAGISCGRHRIARLMRENGLKALMKRRYKKTTDSAHGGPVAANLLDQDFSAEGPNRKWGVDISYVWTAEGWLYLAVVIDLYSRRVVGWAVSDRMKKDLAMTALLRAITIRRPSPGLIHHSDRGSQYCSDDSQKILQRNGMKISMSGKGNCYDNAMVEAFFKTLKSELIWRTVFLSRRQAECAIGTFIDGFYNPIRRHSALGYKSPVLFEATA
jgi:transposase InsO family protein